ncbi:hypothetical protein ES703_70596 [subsurface metagenome]
MKRKFSKILGIGLTLALLASMLVTAAPVSAQTLGTVNIESDWYTVPGPVTVTVTDSDFAVVKAEARELVGIGDGTNKDFTVLNKPIVDVTEDSIVDFRDVTVYDDFAVVTVYSVDAATGVITLTAAPSGPTLLLAEADASGTPFSPTPTEATRLQLVLGIGTVAGAIEITGTDKDDAILEETVPHEGGSATLYTTNFFKTVDADGLDASGIKDDVEVTDTIAVNEVETILVDYSHGLVTTVDVTVATTTAASDITVTLTSGPGTGVFEGLFSLDLTTTNDGEDKILAADGDTITVTYTDDKPVGETSQDEAMVDTTPPTITPLVPTECVATATPAISATLDDDDKSGIDEDSISLSVAGTTIAEGYTYDPATGLLSYTPTVALSEASIPVLVNVNDLVGNSATEASWSFTVDTTDPAIDTDTLTAPNGEEVWAGGSSQDITWTSGDITDTNLGDNPISLHYSTDSGATYPFEIVTGLDNTGSYSWTVPIVDSEAVSVQITATDLAGNTASDESNAVFTIDSTAPTLLGIAWTDVDEAGGVSAGDTLLFIFSEDIATGTVILANIDTDLPISATGATYGTTGLTVDWGTLAGDDTLTVILGAGVDIVVGDTVNPADTVTDFVGNPDDTAAPGAAILPPAPTEIAVTATLESILADGIATSSITATVTMYGKAVQDVKVSFSTTAGIIYPTEASTVANGEATATLTVSTMLETATVTASAEGVTPATVDVTFVSDEFTVPNLAVGWNLISLPLIPVDPRIGSVLGDLLGDLEITETVEVVWSYDAATYDWYYYQPSTGYGDLLQMVDGRGYWVKMVEPASAPTLSGMENPAPGKTPSQYAVVVGWNLIGFRSISGVTADAYLESILFTKIYAYGGTGYLPMTGSESLVPGSGYWVYVTAPGYIAP